MFKNPKNQEAFLQACPSSRLSFPFSVPLNCLSVWKAADKGDLLRVLRPLFAPAKQHSYVLFTPVDVLSEYILNFG